MWAIIQHDLQKVRSLIIFAVVILLSLSFSGAVVQTVSDAKAILINNTLTITLIYTGIMFLNLYFSDRKQGTLFFLLSSPQSRTVIYWAKICTVLIMVTALLLLQIVIHAYKNFGWMDFLSQDVLGTLPGIFYLSLANALFFGSLCTLLSQFIHSGLIRWTNVLITAYAIGALISLLFHRTAVEGLLPQTVLLQVLNILFYQRFIFLSDNGYLYGSLFLLASFVIFWASSQIFTRRNFYAA